MDFNNFEQMMNFIVSSTEAVLNTTVSDMAKEEFKRSKKENVYDIYSPQEYQRTYEFLNSNNTKKGKSLKNSVWMTLYTDTTSASQPSKHPSWTNGRNMNNAIPYFMQFGTNSPLFDLGARDYISPAVASINSKIKQSMINGYRSFGITAS